MARLDGSDDGGAVVPIAAVTTPTCELDVRVDGALRIIMRGPDGNDYPMHGVFTEVVPETRLVVTNIPTDGSGNHLMEGETRVTFADAGGQTELTVAAHMVGCVPMAKRMLAGMEAGWTRTIDKLGEMLGKR
ncbi:MAG TPA: SRPBCC family protein [Pseudolabrys sp.]